MALVTINSPLRKTQGGVATISSGNLFVDVTISSVNVAKCAVQVVPQNQNGTYASYNYSDLTAKGVLTSPTNLRLSRTTNGAVSILIGWQVIEHN